MDDNELRKRLEEGLGGKLDDIEQQLNPEAGPSGGQGEVVKTQTLAELAVTTSQGNEDVKDGEGQKEVLDGKLDEIERLLSENTDEALEGKIDEIERLLSDETEEGLEERVDVIEQLLRVNTDEGVEGKPPVDGEEEKFPVYEQVGNSILEEIEEEPEKETAEEVFETKSYLQMNEVQQIEKKNELERLLSEHTEEGTDRTKDKIELERLLSEHEDDDDDEFEEEDSEQVIYEFTEEEGNVYENVQLLKDGSESRPQDNASTPTYGLVTRNDDPEKTISTPHRANPPFYRKPPTEAMEEESLSESPAPARRNFLQRHASQMCDITRTSEQHYFNSWIGRIKVLQFFFVLLAGAILPSVTNGFLFSRYAFFVFIVWTSFMYIVIDLFLHLTGLHSSVPKSLASPALLLTLLSLGFFLFLISSSLIVSASSSLEGSQDVTSILAATCGFIVMALFAAEGVIRLREVLVQRARMSAPSVETDI